MTVLLPALLGKGPIPSSMTILLTFFHVPLKNSGRLNSSKFSNHVAIISSVSSFRRSFPLTFSIDHQFFTILLRDGKVPLPFRLWSFRTTAVRENEGDCTSVTTGIGLSATMQAACNDLLFPLNSCRWILPPPRCTSCLGDTRLWSVFCFLRSLTCT